MFSITARQPKVRKILEAWKNANDRKLTHEQEFQKKLMEQVRFIEQYGHSLGLGKKIEIEGPIPGRKMLVETEGTQGYIAVSELASELKELKQQAMDFGAKEKSKFTHFRRKTKIKKLAAGNRLNFPQNEIFNKVSFSFLVQHYKDPEVSLKKLHKRLYELEYARDLLLSLNNGTRKYFVDMLKKNGVDLSNLIAKIEEIVKQSHDQKLKEQFVLLQKEFNQLLLLSDTQTLASSSAKSAASSSISSSPKSSADTKSTSADDNNSRGEDNNRRKPSPHRKR